MKRKFFIAIVFTLIVTIGTISFKTFNDNDDFELFKNLEIYHNILENLRQHYVQNIDPRQIITNSVEKMLEDLDPYTVYIPEAEIETIRMLAQSTYIGVGFSVDTMEGDFYVVEVVENSPAHSKGVQVGDKIVEVNNKSLENETLNTFRQLTVGQIGTSVSCKINRNSKILNFNLIRKQVNIKDVTRSTTIDDVGYIKLENFSAQSATSLSNEFLKLQKQKIKGLIIDLRNNPGGLLDQAVKIVNIFIAKNKTVVISKGQSLTSNNVYVTTNRVVDANIPLIILVNKKSASASEIVAGTLQDYDRAVILGEQTFGKGLVQRIFDVGYNSKLKVTVSRYYIPSGRCIQNIDYFHDTKTKLADSTKFYTSGGRTVYQGNGIKPDILMSIDTIDTTIKELLTNKYIYKFCNFYYPKIDTATITTPLDVNFSDKKTLFDFLEKSDFYEKNYYVNNILEIEKLFADKSKSIEEVNQLKALIIKKINENINANFITISKLISREIVKRKFFQQGVIEYNLKNDPEILKAVKILKNPQEYSQILRKK